MTDLNDVVSQLAALNAAMSSSDRTQQPAWPAPSTAIMPVSAAPAAANPAALLQMLQQQLTQAAPVEEPNVLDEVRRLHGRIDGLSLQLDSIVEAMRMLARQVAAALAEATKPKPPPLLRRTELSRLPLLDPDDVTPLDDTDGRAPG